MYVAPVMEIINVKVENGFAGSDGTASGGGYEDGGDE